MENKSRKSLIEIYCDELDRRVASMRECIDLHYRRRVFELDAANAVHEDGLRMLADAEVARIIDAAGAAGSCCPRCGNCRGPVAAVDDEGASHD